MRAAQAKTNEILLLLNKGSTNHHRSFRQKALVLFKKLL